MDLVSSVPEERQTDLKELGLNERQIEALRLMVNEKESITNRKYCQIFQVSRNTAYLDLSDLIQKNLIFPKKRGRSAFYIAN